jgi:hypothetical protein
MQLVLTAPPGSCTLVLEIDQGRDDGSAAPWVSLLAAGIHEKRQKARNEMSGLTRTHISVPHRARWADHDCRWTSTELTAVRISYELYNL